VVRRGKRTTSRQAACSSILMCSRRVRPAADAERQPESRPCRTWRNASRSGLVGCLLNPDPGECSGVETPPLGDALWYPLYESRPSSNVPATFTRQGCRLGAAAVLAPFHQRRNVGRRIAAELAGVQRLSDAQISCRTAAAPSRISTTTLRASSLRGKGPALLRPMRKLYLHTVLYSKDALELLFKTVRRRPVSLRYRAAGRRHGERSETGRWLDETRLHNRVDRLADRGGQKQSSRTTQRECST